MSLVARISPSGNLGDVIRADASDGYLLDASDGRRHALPVLDRAADVFAAELLARGLSRGDRVALLAPNGAVFVVAYLGIMRAGLVAVPLNYRLPAETCAFILQDCNVRMAVADPGLAALVPSVIGTLPLPATDAPAHFPPIRMRPTPDDVAEILYTSGSTGRPKGVPLSHEGQLWALRRFAEASGDEPQRTVIAAPTYHMNGLFFTTMALAMGWAATIMPRFDAAAYLGHVSGQRCTMLSGIPTMFALMARERELLATLDLGSVTDIVIGSAPLTQPLVDRVAAIFPNAAIRNGYGTTETGPAMFGPHPGGLPRPPLSLGHPYPDVEWRLVDGPDPSQGVLETRTPATLRGYLNLPAENAARLSEGWFRTGDILRHDADHFFHFVGRADDMFVCGGENVYPGEVEKLLERHETVLQAAVVDVPDELKGAIPIAFVVPMQGATIDTGALKAFMLAHGPAFSHPRAIEVMETLPIGGTHKIDRARLRHRAAELALALSRR